MDRKPFDTGALKRFAQEARRVLRDQVSAKLAQVLAENSAARREASRAVKELEGEIDRTSRDHVTERVAYTWFNRFTALRFMDIKGYTGVRVVTPADGQTRPEILSEATAGVVGEEVPEATATQVRALLDNRTPSNDPQGEAYRLLLVATCNYWHGAMPFMFETIADYTELLMPEDLLSQGSILAKLRVAMTEDACQDVEIIGWLYQFYISEKKDEVFAGLKKNKKIAPENIPAATQLFTPHWIVRYLVENSLGRLWMLNRPNSRLKERMDYYIAPEGREADFLRISSPEEIKICDPACGSGHMLTYAFDLLYVIYEEEGYDAAAIPGLILTHNLYGIEVDERAGALAAFALTMKAAARRNRSLRHGVQPCVCVLKPVKFEPGELDDYVDAIGRDLFTAPLRETLAQFDEADNFGSLIRPTLTSVADIRRIIESKDVGGNLFLRDVHARVQTVLRMVGYLAPKYHVVVANPPYMAAGGMNARLSTFSVNMYRDSKADLFAMFMDRAIELTLRSGMAAMVTIQNWMFLSSFEAIRARIVSGYRISRLLQIGYNSFPELNSKVVQAAAFVIDKTVDDCPGYFINANNAPQSADKETLSLKKIKASEWTRASRADFDRIPGKPIAYWVSEEFRKAFETSVLLREMAAPRAGLATGDNERFQRYWSEVSLHNIAFNCRDGDESRDRSEKWYPCNSGGQYRKWYGNNEIVVNWMRDGREIRNFKDTAGKLRSRPQNTEYYFRPGVTWTKLGSGNFAARLREPGYVFDDTGRSAFPDAEDQIPALLALMCSNAANAALKILNPSLSFTSGDIGNLPFPANAAGGAKKLAVDLASRAKADWDAYETSWGFSTPPILLPQFRGPTFAATYAHLREHWRRMTQEVQQLEEANNRIFIAAYGLQEELTPEVPLEEITLTCNPAYRYGGKKTDDELEALLLADTMREFVSYSVGCMFGRYSLDVPGLILASQGEGLCEYLNRISKPTLVPDADNVIPVLDSDWFANDIAERFRKFMRITFGEEHFQENLVFVEEALGRDIRKYFIRDFFNDHVKRYNKRPIYWMFSSPNGTFNAMIYMHRYRPDTVSVVLNDYLRELRAKLEAHRRAQETLSINADASSAQKTKALKEIEAAAKQIDELNDWERRVLFPLATQKIEIDLDEGVKTNYPKFGAALKPIKGLGASDD